jgi:hypothetical protein
MYEALQRLRLNAFLDTLEDESRVAVQSFILDMRNSFPDDELQSYTESQEFADLITHYEAFITETSAKSKTFAYWSLYIKMAGKVKLFMSNLVRARALLSRLTRHNFHIQFLFLFQVYFLCSFERPDKLIGISICQRLDL